MDRRGGFTLIELMITVTIVLLVVPAILSSLIVTQKTSARVNHETEVRQQLRNHMDRMVNEVRGARAVFSSGAMGTSDVVAITDEVAGLAMPNASAATATPYLTLPAHGSALALMRFDGTKTFAGGTTDIYRLVIYYLHDPTPLTLLVEGNTDPLTLRRFEGSRGYFDPAMLTPTQRSTATSQGYVAWAPPGPGATPTRPESNPPGQSRTLTTGIAPPGAYVRGKKVPQPGGFAVTRDGNSITIYLMGYADKQTYLLQSQTLARNFQL